MEPIKVGAFVSFTVAILLLFVGKRCISKYEILRKYSIPEPVIGGFLCALTVAVIYGVMDTKITFELPARDLLLLYFFAAMGLNASIRSLLDGGKPLLMLIILAAIYIVFQNSVGMSIAYLFGMDPKAGLMSGSVALIGGVGTTLAWAPTFVEHLNIENALELGIASNTIGLIFACVIGGPITNYLMKKYAIEGNDEHDLDVGSTHVNEDEHISSYSLLFAWLRLNIAVIFGYVINHGLTYLNIELPMFVSCLLAGILIGNRTAIVFPKPKIEGSDRGLSLISDICLGMFIVMALMDLKIWELSGVMGYISVVMAAQIFITILFTIVVVFKLMGKDYESSVICSGFGGITLGSTATAIANMTAVTKENGSAKKAFLLVPLVCGFFVDILNAIAINFFIAL
ncbi:sodium/glutamate symporter [Vibrio sp. SS-MA-C1-2]|uniref:sodium/glutamate symporter n=1 Tax=Vibrio sp. SS-MA-C1-2 TaxID=2908646 RepID=UPI001F4146A4|nr:sodium/glutamate symporter [Vibrio sp. SS-MA-C1-2]UJF18880.1 sodium/glutamate symporter [Vibrio sp. SS-MA-C1-2]